MVGLPPHERAAALAAAGCFNEALDLALQQRAAWPDDASRQQAVAELLEAARE